MSSFHLSDAETAHFDLTGTRLLQWILLVELHQDFPKCKIFTGECQPIVQPQISYLINITQLPFKLI